MQSGSLGSAVQRTHIAGTLNFLARSIRTEMAPCIASSERACSDEGNASATVEKLVRTRSAAFARSFSFDFFAFFVFLLSGFLAFLAIVVLLSRSRRDK